jgi:SAM-dependent methyltransferase
MDSPWESMFDLVGVYDVLEHLEDDRQAIGALKKVLKINGGILITVPQHPELWSSTDEDAQHTRRYRPGELEGKLRETGFSVVYSTSFVSLPLPALWYSRRRPKTVAHCELTLPPALNGSLGALLYAERLLLKSGIRLPLGGSRLVAARKTEV